MSQQQIAAARHLELRHLAVQGAVSGLFFAQTLSWQQFIDVLVVHVFGASADEPGPALGRALLVTLFTSGLAWLVLLVGRRCAECSSMPQIEIRTCTQ